MYGLFRKTLTLALLGIMGFCSPAGAQSIAFSPAAPQAGDAISVTFTQPFDCAAPTPSATTGDGLTFASTLPYGIVHCPFIPAPPPLTSAFTVPVGALSAGTYAVTWNRYQAQPSGLPRLLSSATATLRVGVGNRGAGAAVASAPAASLPACLALAALCMLFGWRGLRTQPGGVLSRDRTRRAR